MADETKFFVDDAMLPTKEILRRQRKAEYQRFKRYRTGERRQRQIQKDEETVEQQAIRDQKLWAELRPASQLRDQHDSD